MFGKILRKNIQNEISTEQDFIQTYNQQIKVCHFYLAKNSSSAEYNINN
jgi:hypothetical protein